MKKTAFLELCRYLFRQIKESEGQVSIGLVGLVLFISLHEAEIFTYPELSNLLGLSTRTLHDYVKILESNKILTRVSSNQGIALTLNEGIYPSKFCYSNALSPIHTISSLNNKREENKNSKNLEAHEKIIADLNTVSGKAFRLNATDTIKKISWLLDHDYTFEDFQKVHRAKLDWLQSPKMAIYYRPKTLYAQENFESYLNEKRGVDPSKATTSKWKAPEKQHSTSARRKILEERWGKHEGE